MGKEISVTATAAASPYLGMGASPVPLSLPLAAESFTARPANDGIFLSPLATQGHDLLRACSSFDQMTMGFANVVTAQMEKEFIQTLSQLVQLLQKMVGGGRGRTGVQGGNASASASAKASGKKDARGSQSTTGDRALASRGDLVEVQGKQVERQAAGAFSRMAAAARQDGVTLTITSAFRSDEEQSRLWQQALAKYGSADAARKWVAPPGSSNHRTGKALDIRGSDGAWDWLKKNAQRFGFKNYAPEPWHYNYVG